MGAHSQAWWSRDFIIPFMVVPFAISLALGDMKHFILVVIC